MFTRMLYGAAAIWLLFSFCKDREKTMTALKKAWRSFENILPSMLTVLLLIGFVLAILDAETISRLLALRWWDWPPERIAQNLAAIQSGELELLD